jgi:peroxiredoxin
MSRHHAGATRAETTLGGDDALAARLLGIHVPSLALTATTGTIDLADLASNLLVLFVYPHATGLVGAPAPGWELIPGARGCTAEARGFRDHHDSLRHLGADVAGLSVQTVDEQRAFAARVGIQFPLISDPRGELAATFGLPMFMAGTATFYRRLTLIAKVGRVNKIFYPIPEPDRHAADVVAWLQALDA